MPSQIVKSFSEFLFEKKSEKKKYKYGCIMVFFDVPKMDEIHSKIDKDDLYTEEGSSKYGLEDEHHTTLLYGLHEEVDAKDVLSISNAVYKNHGEPIVLKNISLFENEKYDVLKFDAHSEWLNLGNKVISEVFPFTTDFPDYHPHCTIAYLKSGTGKKYVKMFKGKNLDVVPTQFVYSKPDGSKETKKISLNLNESSHFKIYDLDKANLKRAAKAIKDAIDISLDSDEDSIKFPTDDIVPILSFESTGLHENPRKINIYVSFSQDERFRKVRAEAEIGQTDSQIVYYGFWNSNETVDDIYYTLVHELVHSLDPKLYKHEVSHREEMKAQSLGRGLDAFNDYDKYIHSSYEFEAWTSSFCEKVLDSFSVAIKRVELQDNKIVDAISSLESALKLGNIELLSADFKTIVFNSEHDFENWKKMFNSYFSNKQVGNTWKKFVSRAYNTCREVRDELKIWKSIN